MIARPDGWAGNSPRSGTMTIAGLTFTVTQAGFNAISNPGFEGGTAPWVLSGQAAWSTGQFPHSGTGYVSLGQLDNTTSTVFQTIVVPAGGAKLSFALNTTTTEPITSGNDQLFIEVRSTSAQLLQRLFLFTTLNQHNNAPGNYTIMGQFSLNAFAGQTVRIQFRAINDSSLPTTFRLDDVVVQ